MATGVAIGQRLGADLDFQDFLTWYTLRVQRRTGKLPAASTLASKRSRLRSACAALPAVGYVLQQQDSSHEMGLCDISEQTLGYVLGNHQAVEALLDALSLRLSSGALRNTYDALQDF